jgi:S1-C subfamily serine protease
MSLPDIIERIAPSVVALGSRLVVSRAGQTPAFPRILGTGFVVDSRGIVVTNEHVARALERLPRDSRLAIFFPPIQIVDGKRMQGVILRDILAFSFLGSFLPQQPYYGPAQPDFAFLQVDVKGLTSLELNRAPGVIRTGADVAVAGFPLGDSALTVFGGLNQLSATVRKGIISSVHPSPAPYPDGFTVDVTIQGGNSGSPVFLTESGLVVGILHAHIESAPNFALALPSNMIALGLEASLAERAPNLYRIPTWDSVLKEPAELGLSWQKRPFPLRSESSG